tara:strand:- start:89 stop:283 length:195 start_codon:yes stop_codon:yes gene_type:complete
MIIHQRIIAVIALVVSLFLITLDYYYSEKINQKNIGIKLNNQRLDSEQSTNEQHHDEKSSPCGM